MVSRHLVLAGLIVLVNVPFGHWRVGVKRFTASWFIAVHATIPLIALLRYVMGVGWHWQHLPLFAGAYAAGQFLGGQWRKRRIRQGR